MAKIPSLNELPDVNEITFFDSDPHEIKETNDNVTDTEMSVKEAEEIVDLEEHFRKEEEIKNQKATSGQLSLPESFKEYNEQKCEATGRKDQDLSGHSLIEYLIRLHDFVRQLQESLETISRDKLVNYTTYKSLKKNKIFTDLGKRRSLILKEFEIKLQFCLDQSMHTEELCKLFLNLQNAFGSTDRIVSYEQDLHILERVYDVLNREGLLSSNPDRYFNRLLYGKVFRFPLNKTDGLLAFQTAHEFSLFLQRLGEDFMSRRDECAKLNDEHGKLLKLMKSTLTCFINDNKITLGQYVSRDILTNKTIKNPVPSDIKELIVKKEWQTDYLLNRLIDINYELVKKIPPKLEDFVNYAYKNLQLLVKETNESEDIPSTS